MGNKEGGREEGKEGNLVLNKLFRQLIPCHCHLLQIMIIISNYQVN